MFAWRAARTAPSDRHPPIGRAKETAGAGTRHYVRATTEIRVLNAEDDLIAAANVFRVAMVGFPPLSDLPPGQITKLLDPGRTIGAFVGGNSQAPRTR